MRSKMRLSTKLILAFGILIIIQIGGNVTSLFLLGHINANVTELATDWLPSIDTAGDIDHEFQALRRSELMHILSTTDAAMDEYEARLKKSMDALKKSMASYEPLISSPNERQIFQDFRRDFDAYLAAQNKLLALSRQNKKDEARQLAQGDSRQQFYAAQDDLQKLIALNGKGSEESAKEGSNAYFRGRVVLISLLVGATLLGVVVCLIIIRGVSRQLGEDPGYLFDVASRIAAGEMDIRFKDHTGDGGVFAVLKQMVANLKGKIAEADKKSVEAAEEAQKAKEATQAAEAAKAEAENAKAQGMLQAADRLSSVVGIVSSASEELSAQIEESSQGADHQSRRLTETATAMEEMNATVLEVARSASQAAEISIQARKKAEEGAQAVEQVVSFMQEINNNARQSLDDMAILGKQAESIGQILNVISDIADQTNLLALNAAIEAARAGEAGRGFAVVADEVRKLAEKTMTATKEVGEAVRSIQGGTRKNYDNVSQAVSAIGEITTLAGQSGQTLGEIVSLVDTTADQVRSIATASEEQSSASEEINRSVEEVNRIAAETMDGLRQSAQAVAELAKQAQELNAMVQEMQGGSAAGTGKRATLPGGRRPRALS